MWFSVDRPYQVLLTQRENVDMKIVFVALVLVAAAASSNATGIASRTDQNHGRSNAPVCPDGQVAQFVGVINGKATWRCVPA